LRAILLPIGIPLLSGLLNRYVGRLPVVEWLSLMYGIIARPSTHRFPAARPSQPSTSVVIPCRNEAGHIRPLVERLPELGPNSEFLFVEGNSKDDTEAVIRAVIEENPLRPFRLLKQTGKGKGDAVRLGFAHARGEVVLILDSDMGVAPEDVPKFVQALVRGTAMINGHTGNPKASQRFLNMLANKFFAYLFSWLLGQQVRDTLCGTKALYREDYERIAANRSHFGDFDPFGDFDLLFGASRLNLRIVDLAVRYHERRYGETNISRFRHGWLLLRMSLFAARSEVRMSDRSARDRARPEVASRAEEIWNWDSPRPPTGRAPRRFLRRARALWRGRRALELGCGTAYLLNAARRDLGLTCPPPLARRVVRRRQRHPSAATSAACPAAMGPSTPWRPILLHLDLKPPGRGVPVLGPAAASDPLGPVLSPAGTDISSSTQGLSAYARRDGFRFSRDVRRLGYEEVAIRTFDFHPWSGAGSTASRAGRHGQAAPGPGDRGRPIFARAR
jgi:glycosyltransferase involved in cell wall biosynthesis